MGQSCHEVNGTVAQCELVVGKIEAVAITLSCHCMLTKL